MNYAVTISGLCFRLNVFVFDDKTVPAAAVADPAPDESSSDEDEQELRSSDEFDEIELAVPYVIYFQTFSPKRLPTGVPNCPFRKFSRIDSRALERAPTANEGQPGGVSLSQGSSSTHLSELSTF